MSHHYTLKLTDEQAIAASGLCEAATSFKEMSMRLDKWIEWRAGDGTEKYSIAEFEREADQEFFYFARKYLPDAIHDRNVAKAEAERLDEREKAMLVLLNDAQLAMLSDLDDPECPDARHLGLIYRIRAILKEPHP
jgi:hypothetical protein